MVSVFFCCHNLSMDMRKLCKKLFENEDIKKIPLKYVVTVVHVVFELINSGECFYKNEEDL